MPEPAVVSYTLELDFPEDIKEIALEQGEDPNVTCQLMQQLKDMVYEKGDCNPHRMDDDFLIKFLRARFWKVDNAYKLVCFEFLAETLRIFMNHLLYENIYEKLFFQLCRYTKLREDNIQWVDKVNPLKLALLGEENIISTTPYRDQTGKRMLIYRFGNWKPSKVPIDELFKATLVVLDIGIMEPRAQVLGGVGIFDLEGLSMNHTFHMSPSVAQKMIAMMVVSSDDTDRRFKFSD